MTYSNHLHTALRTLKRHAAAIAVLVLLVAALFTVANRGDLLKQSAQTALLNQEQAKSQPAEPDYVVGAELERMDPLPVQQVDTETLWLARGIYSETKQAQEQELVAWTIRNRVETRYRGNASYQEAVLDPYQYSAFIEGTSTRAHYTSLTAQSREAGFQNALAIAKQVKEAEAEARPFSETTRHFFSEQSMKGGRHPNWSVGEEPVVPSRPIVLDAKRFRFYEDIA